MRLPDLKKIFLPLFSVEVYYIYKSVLLNSNHVSQIHIKKPICAKFEVTYVSLVCKLPL